MPIVTVTAAIAGLKNTIDLAKAAIAARDELKLAEMQQSINDRIIDVQNAALALQEKQSSARDEIDRLKDELREAKKTIEALETERSQSNNYELTKLSEYGYAYKYVGPDEPEHLICQPCYDGPGHRKTVLKFNPINGRYAAHYVCPTCKNIVRG
ncbi:TPA: hypothetical protein RJR39_003563 [Burkholderia cenocepacia]|uniref:hypothetical protein n=1 Tax=Burkholderia cenocepacia TaxID=95486 RepID=UPI001B937D88|nr:hypothetical protein [Burkholderia cenocepacia]MBR8196332.1 hypothetical protein [Burkholderia cenocepacia]HDV6327470.1 hypothetical protein [Burkholderia cenocepacia]HDV6351342.1 hypothetical protein [Burkholderia cenocepacia]